MAEDDLIQAVLRDDPWKMLVACVLLNRTSWRQAYPALDAILGRWPGPLALAAAGSDLEAVLRPLGLFQRRAATLRALSARCVDIGSWPTHLEPGDLPGVGRYAADSYNIFVGRIPGVVPTDRWLLAYLDGRCHKCGGPAEINDGDDAQGPPVCCGCYSPDVEERA